MNPTELIAAALGLVNVALVVRRSLWNYPFGIAMVAIYFFVFLEARLYSDALLQLFFAAIQFYGWWNWRNSERVDSGVAIERLPARAGPPWIAGIALGAVVWGTGMASWTDAAAPYADATVAAMSIAAQILQSRRKVESWALWIAVDLLAIGLFWSRGLVATTILYGIFLAMSVAGLIAWARTARIKVEPAPPQEGST